MTTSVICVRLAKLPIILENRFFLLKAEKLLFLRKNHVFLVITRLPGFSKNVFFSGDIQNMVDKPCFSGFQCEKHFFLEKTGFHPEKRVYL